MCDSVIFEDNGYTCSKYKPDGEYDPFNVWFYKKGIRWFMTDLVRKEKQMLGKELIINDLKELLLEALPYVEDAIDSPDFKKEYKPKIRGLAKRIRKEIEND